MTPRWRIRRTRHREVRRWNVWTLFLDGKRITSYWSWDECLEHIDKCVRKFGNPL